MAKNRNGPNRKYGKQIELRTEQNESNKTETAVYRFSPTTWSGSKIGVKIQGPTGPLEKKFSGPTVFANYIGPSVMTDANCEGFPICDDRITENDRCVIK